MRLSIACLFHEHADGRVTITPIEQPRLAVHAESEEKALEELILALEDRLARTHPARVAEYTLNRNSELVQVAPEILEVHEGEGKRRVPMPLVAVQSIAHGPYLELLLPGLDLRYWVPRESDPLERVAALVEEHHAKTEVGELLSGRKMGRVRLEAVVIEAEPPRLADMTFEQIEQPHRLLPFVSDEDRKAKQQAKEKAKPKREEPKTTTLDAVATPLHQLAREDALAPAFEVDALVEELERRLLGPKPMPVVLVGPAGVGKTALVHEIVRRAASAERREREQAKQQQEPERADSAEDDPPPKLRAYFLDGARLVAGQGFFGEWEEQTRDCLDEARECGALLHLGHAVELLDAGKTAHSARNIAQLLGPALLTQKWRAIAEATPEEWSTVEARSQVFARAFAVVHVREPDTETLARIIGQIANAHEKQHQVRVAPEAQRIARLLVTRFMPYCSPLGQSVAFLQRLVDDQRRRNTVDERAPLKPRREPLGRVDVIRRFSRESGIPEVLLRDDLALPIEQVQSFLSKRVLGQQPAVERLVESVVTIKAGIADPGRPMAVLFFLGPTGVGKTQLAKALAELVFGSENRLIRLDMGEYAGPDVLQRLVGTQRSPGALVAAVRQQPFCVLLLDEFEKAHPAAFDTMLGVLGEGRLSDAAGKLADFRNSIIVMTSNLGADTVRARVGFGRGAIDAISADELREHYLGEARRRFRPELFNRIDDFVVFGALAPETIRSIVDRELELLRHRDGIRNRQVVLDVAQPARDWLAEHGFDARYGARPLQRAIERELVVLLARGLARQSAGHATRAKVSVVDGALSAQLIPGEARASAEQHRLEALARESANLRRALTRLRQGRWATELRRRTNTFARLSKHKAYWDDHQLAEAEASLQGRIADALRTADDLGEQAEQLEELALEAYHQGSGEEAITLSDELEGLRGRLPEARVELFAAPRVVWGGVTLYVCPSRGADRHAEWLIASYEHWLQKQEQMYTVFVALDDPEAARAASDISKKRAKNTPFWKWRELNDPLRKRLDKRECVAEAWACAVRGDHRSSVLGFEHGRSCFREGADTRIVTVTYEPRCAKLTTLRTAEQLVKGAPTHQVRAVLQGSPPIEQLPSKRRYDAHRTHFDLAPILDDAVAEALESTNAFKKEDTWS